jgi:hypothetical protein
MTAIAGLFLVLGTFGLIIGIGLCIPYGTRERGKSVAFCSGVAVAFALGFAFFIAPQPRASASTETKQVEAQPAQLTKKDLLAKMRIGGFAFDRVAFGSVMEARFVIYNDNPVPVKDIEITCEHTANSGTKIDSNTRTIYERIEKRSYYAVPKMNMGFIHSAVARSSCTVTNLGRV